MSFNALKFVGWFGIALLVAGCSRGDSGVSDPPNVVVYLVDTLRRDHLGLYGYERETSPRLDDFASDAIVYERAYSTTGWTRPAAASVLTGLVPGRHGAVTLDDRLSADIELLSESLLAKGYATAAFVTNVNVTDVWGFDQGFEHFDDVRARTGKNDAEIVIDACEAHLEADSKRPFFLYVHTQDPHGNYNPPGEYADLFRAPGDSGPALKPAAISSSVAPEALRRTIAAYDGEIAYSDAQFGRFLDFLKAKGLYDNTFIFYVSDHGEEFVDHAGGGHGHTLYEELVRIPMLVKFPGARYAGARIAQPVSLVDVVPTVLDYLGQPIEGRDGSPLPTTPGEGDRALVLSLDVLRFDETPQIADAIVEGDHKLIERTHPTPIVELYDLSADPGEQANIAQAEPDRVFALSARLAHERSSLQAGLHLRFIGERGVRSTFRGELTTTGRFVDVERVGFEEGDGVTLSDDGHRLRFEVAVEDYENPRKGGNLPAVQDQDRILFRLEPPDAEFTVASFSASNGSGLRLGEEQKTLRDLPARFTAETPDLVAAPVSGLRRTSAGARDESEAGAFLLSIRKSAAGDFEVDQSIRDRLRDLGYTR